MPTGKQPCPWCPAVLVPEYFERHVAAHRLFLADCARREMPPGVTGDEEECLPMVACRCARTPPGPRIELVITEALNVGAQVALVLETT